jgi:D-ribose pyranose/furanose isomerase RbsD
MRSVMTSKELDAALDGMKKFLQSIEEIKCSLQLVKVLLASRFVGADQDQIRSFVEELNRTEIQLSALARQDIHLVFEALKHLLRKGSVSPDA